MKIKYPNNKVLSNHKLKLFLQGGVSRSVCNIYSQNNGPRKEFLFVFSSFSFISLAIGLSAHLFMPIAFSDIFSLFSLMTLSTILSSVLVTFFIITLSVLLKFFLKRKHKVVFDIIYMTCFDLLFIKEAIKFSKKYNLEEIKKSLDNHDFQSPHLKGFIDDNFSFSQDDLSVLSHNEILSLNEKIKHNKKASKILIKALGKNKSIRKIDKNLLLELSKVSKNKSSVKKSNPLEIILKNINKKESLPLQGNCFKDVI